MIDIVIATDDEIIINKPEISEMVSGQIMILLICFGLHVQNE